MMERGWLARQNAALAKKAKREADWESYAQQRSRDLAAQERAAVEAAEARQARLRAKVVCPCCDGEGTVEVRFAERLIRALERLPANSLVDENVIAKLIGVAMAYPQAEAPRVHQDLGLAPIRKPEPIQFDGAAETGGDASSDEDAIAAITGKRRGK